MVRFLFLIAVIAMGAGAWNYQRNLALESQKVPEGPFSGYSDEGLAQLADAYGGEVVTLGQRHAVAQQVRVEVRQTGSADGNAREFDRAAEAKKEIRAVGSDAAKSKTRLIEVQAEIRRRDKAGRLGWELHVKRLTAMN